MTSGVSVDGVLSELGLTDRDASPALLAAVRGHQVVWANAAALALFAVPDLVQLGNALFEVDPAARSFAKRLAGVGWEPRLERLTAAGALSPVTAVCVGTGAMTDERFVLIRMNGALSIPALARVSEDVATSPEPRQDLQFEADAAVRATRVLWEADRDGIVTRLELIRDLSADLDLPVVGHSIAAQVRPYAPRLAQELDTLLTRVGPMDSIRGTWSRSSARGEFSVELGCSIRPGRSGLRGFLLIHRQPGGTPAEQDAPRKEVSRSVPATLNATLPDLNVSDMTSEAADRPTAAVNVPAPQPQPAANDVSPSPPPAERGNVVHFPSLRTSATATQAPDVLWLPALEPVPVASPSDTDAPLWSESPDGLADPASTLTAEEQDAFAHIAKVLGTRAPVGEEAPADAVLNRAEPPDHVQDVLDAIPLGVLLRRGGRVHVNPAFLARTGDFTAGALHARLGGLDLTSPGALKSADGTTLGADVREVVIGGEPAHLVWLLPPGSSDQTASEERNRHDDLTSLGREPDARSADAPNSAFLAKVGREIRSTMKVILTSAEVMRDGRLGPVDDRRQSALAREIHASGTHVLHLVDGLLDLSRLQAGHMNLRLEAVDANAAVQACLDAMQVEAQRRQIVLRLSLASQLPAALADESSFRRILLNLLSNAVKFTEAGGQVIVSTAAMGSHGVAIRIRDTGLGMTEREIAAVMEPLDSLSSSERAGSGLGLPLTKALVEANCASMAIRSTHGEGTLVEVTFPIVEPGAASRPA